MTPHAWTIAGHSREETLWRRPGKDFGFSATTNYKGSELLYVFSTNAAPFEHEHSYSKFMAFALLEKGGDLKAAARAIADKYDLPKQRNNGHAASQAEPRSEPTNEPGEENSDDEAPKPTKYSDDSLADLFSTRHDQDFLYVHEWGWLRWIGTHWLRVPDVAIMDYARQICRQQSEFCKDDDELHPKAKEGLARSLASAKTVAAVVRLAASDPRHYRTVSQFDQNRWLFNTPGDTIDLRTGTLRRHTREDQITKISRATPRGESSKWQGFLEQITNHDIELERYLQRLSGYALCGDPSEECLDFFYGVGGNGKGTLLKTLQHILGDYSTTAATETFLETKTEKHPTDVAKLAGARLDHCTGSRRWAAVE